MKKKLNDKVNKKIKNDVGEKSEDLDNECTHHWVIEPPNGSISKGKCKNCNESKEFRNSFEYSSWYGAKSPNLPADRKKK